MSFQTINPATEEVLKQYEELTPLAIDEKLFRAYSVFLRWQSTDYDHRAELMLNASKILIEKREYLADLMAREMGKPLAQGVAEAEKCAWVCEYYAQNAESQLRDHHIKTEMSESFVTYRPLGPVLAIMPWNFPFWQVFRFAAPALMAGNTGILKHSRNTMGCAIEIEKIFLDAGFPQGAFTNLVIGSEPVEGIIKSPMVKAVTLTGSTPVGKMVASQAGSCLKKTVLELGGSDPYVILEDCDLEKTATACMTGRLINSGQSCIAAKRFIVMVSILKDFEEIFTQKVAEQKMGDPFDESVFVGPQARKDLQSDLNHQVRLSIEKGAKLLHGGEIPYGKGFFYPPTVLTNVKKGMPVFDDETFGPLAAIIPVKTEEQAIELANDTIFGLGAAVFTEDIERGRKIAREKLHAGCCFVNDFVKSDPRLPFGGIKESGFGRELSSYGIKEFVNVKTVAVK